MLFQVVIEFLYGHSVDSPATLVGLYLLQGFLQVFSLADFLHQLIRVSWVFSTMGRPLRFGPVPSRCAGFTRWQRRKVQYELDILPLVALEIHVLLASPLVRAFGHRFRLGLSVDSTFRLWSASRALPTA